MTTFKENMDVYVPWLNWKPKNCTRVSAAGSKRASRWHTWIKEVDNSPHLNKCSKLRKVAAKDWLRGRLFVHQNKHIWVKEVSCTHT